jgi:hypothetical protein
MAQVYGGKETLVAIGYFQVSAGGDEKNSESVHVRTLSSCMRLRLLKTKFEQMFSLVLSFECFQAHISNLFRTTRHFGVLISQTTTNES